METIKAICLNPTSRKVCYAKLPKHVEDFYSFLKDSGWNLKKIRFNLSGDFDTIINTEDGKPFSLYGRSQNGKTYVTNFNLQQTELINTTATTKDIKENILW